MSREILHADITLVRNRDIDPAEWREQIEERLGPLGEVTIKVEEMTQENVLEDYNANY